ncbi:MAG: alpha-hydroxy-acid oxidizing protein [Nitratireductor sp.]
MRALALGADFVLCGRAFLFGVGALGQSGGDVVAKILKDDIVNNMPDPGAGTTASLSEYLHSPRPGDAVSGSWRTGNQQQSTQRGMRRRSLQSLHRSAHLRG